MRDLKKLIAIISLFLALNPLKAQNCIDSFNINPSFPCPDPTYKPVCGCDGVTYRHLCEAQYRNGVNYTTDGPCSGFEFDLIPTFVTDNNVLKFTFVQNTGQPATFYMLDYFGKVMMQRILPASDNFTIPYILDLPEIYQMRPGPYIVIVVNSKGLYRYKKFVKM